MSPNARAIILSVFGLFLFASLIALGTHLDHTTRARLVAEMHTEAEAQWDAQGYIPSSAFQSHTH